VFIEVLLRDTTDDEIGRVCTEWSVPRDDAPVFSRADARRAWRLRSQLGPEAMASFDARPVPTRRQLVVLYHEVLAWERPIREDITELVAGTDPAVRKAQ
jgi:hypothetical protein